MNSTYEHEKLFDTLKGMIIIFNHNISIRTIPKVSRPKLNHVIENIVKKSAEIFIQLEFLSII